MSTVQDSDDSIPTYIRICCFLSLEYALHLTSLSQIKCVTDDYRKEGMYFKHHTKSKYVCVR